MMNEYYRSYPKDMSAVVFRTKEKYGRLSNMAAGFPLHLGGVDIRTTEALYQAFKFPEHPGVQQQIIDQRSPKGAKMVSRANQALVRPDWVDIQIKVMKWCLSLKLMQNQKAFADALMETAGLWIVELSYRDQFWGARPSEDGRSFVGVNALGRLLMEKRSIVRCGWGTYLGFPPIDNLVLLGQQIKDMDTKTYNA